METELFRFATFELDCRSRELRDGARRVRLQDQPYEILRLMLERPGDVVLTWLTRLHFGRWRDAPVLKAVWAIVGLIPAVMLVTGVIMWWRGRCQRRALAAGCAEGCGELQAAE